MSHSLFASRRAHDALRGTKEEGRRVIATPLPLLERVLLFSLFFALLAPLSIGCGARQQTDEEAAIVELGPDDKIYEYRTVTRQLRAHPLAAEVARELDLVDVWLTRAERMLSDEDDRDRDLLDLQLLTIEGQLIEVRSHLGRREAEEELETSRSSYETRMNKIQTQRERNASQFGRSDAEVNR